MSKEMFVLVSSKLNGSSLTSMTSGVLKASLLRMQEIGVASSARPSSFREG